MEGENIHGAAYPGGREFIENDMPVTNATGLGASGDDFMHKGIDLNEQLISNKPATFFMRVNSDAMIGAGIYNGDIVIIDRSLKALTGKVVIAILNGEMLIRRYEKSFNKIRLLPDSPKLSPIDIDLSCEDFSIWGIVTYVIRSL